MFTLTAVAAILSIPHLAVIYWGVNIAHLEYKTMMAVNGAVALVTAVILRVTSPEWKPRLMSTLKSESAKNEAVMDVLGMFGAFAVSALISNVMLSRQYGVAGWLGLIGTNTLVSWIV